MRTLLVTCLAMSALTLVACEDADEASDCSVICDKYMDCFDDEYDTEACYDRCTERADDMPSRNQEDECESCIDGMSCGEAVFSCTDDCIGIVP